jgi:hypothetical protein
MVDPDQAVALWNELIAAAPVPDPQKARELLIRVQGRPRSSEHPDVSFEPHSLCYDEFVPEEPAAVLLPPDETPPPDLHDLLALFQ